MANIVRRTSASLNRDVQSPDGNDLPARVHRGGGMFVESQLALGLEPSLHLTWAVQPSHWAKGFSLLIFRSMAGFSPEKYPEDLNRHGQLIVETTHNDSLRERPEEGTHYYTFLLHKKCFLGLSEKMAILRFSEHVPSAKVGLGRIKDQLELQSLLQRHTVNAIESETARDEAELRRIHVRRKLQEARDPKPKSVAGDGILADELAAIDALIEGFAVKREKLQSLNTDPKFKKLNRNDRKAIVDAIEQRLDAAELSARRERRT